MKMMYVALRPSFYAIILNPAKKSENSGLNLPPINTNVQTPSTKHKKRFTPQEDEMIVKLYDQYGSKWQRIAEVSGMDRSAAQIRVRYNRIMKKQKSGDLEDRSLSPQSGFDHSSSPTSSLGSTSTSSNGKRRKGHSHDDTSPTKKNKKEVTMSFGENQYYNTSDSNASIDTDLLAEDTEVLRQRVLEYQEINKVLQEKLNKKELESQDILKRLEFLDSTNSQLLDRARGELKRMLIDFERKNRDTLQQQILEDCVMIGQIGFERQGATYAEVWRDGNSYNELKRAKVRLDEDHKELEFKKKALLSKRKHTSNEAEHEEISMQEALLKIRSTVLKGRQIELDEESKRLNIKKQLHIKELRRLNDENHSSFNDFRILKNRYILLQLLGKGGFSEVYRAYDLKNLMQVACKIHQLNPHWPEKKKENYTRHACREYNIHKNLNHPRVVRLFDVFEIDNNSFCTVLEYCNGGDLDSHLKRFGSLAESEARVIITHIFQGLKYLSEQKNPIIHYDLKPGNILFDEPGSIKITDFGLSKIMEEDTNSMELTSQGAGTYWYLPPECFDVDAPRISSKVDVWSAGVIFYQMLFGEKPFGNNLSQQKILQQGIVNRNLVVSFPHYKKVSHEAKEFILKCLTPNQDLRPSVQVLSQDTYLKVPLKKHSNVSKLNVK